MTRYLPGEESPHQHIADQHAGAWYDAMRHDRLSRPQPSVPREQRWRMGIDCDPLYPEDYE